MAGADADPYTTERSDAAISRMHEILGLMEAQLASVQETLVQARASRDALREVVESGLRRAAALSDRMRTLEVVVAGH